VSVWKTKDDENVFAVYWLYLVAGAVAGATFYALYIYPEHGQWHGVFEAIFIAALLTLTVDPFVKKRVAREVNKDIFYHVIGFRLPEEMQDSLQKYLRGLKYYRESLSITVKASRIEDDVLIEVTETSQVVALTKCKYSQSLAFEDAEHGRVYEMVAKRIGSEEKLVEWSTKQPQAVGHPERLMTLYRGPEATLKRGEKLQAFFKYELRGRKADYWVHTFGTTTLKTDVKLLPQDGIQMFASGLGAAKIGEKLEYDNVFIRGEDIHIRWEIPDDPMVTVQRIPQM
jgi:hypothetical protein